MKAKSILQCAALLTGLLFLNVPVFATVESGIVGYTEVTIKPGFNLLAIPFDALDSEDGTPITEVISGSPKNGDTIQYWNGVRLVLVTYLNGWRNGDGVYLKPGQGFWYNSKDSVDKTFHVRGKIAATSDQTIVLETAGMYLIGPTIPKAYTLSEISFSNIQNGSTIQYWDTNETPKRLRIITYIAGRWLLNGTSAADHEILPTEGFWFNAKGAGTTITFPLTTAAE